MLPRCRPRACLAVTAVLTALALSACGQPVTEGEPTVDAATAAGLAETADRLADLIDAGDDCEALAEAELLFSRAREARADGTLSAEVAREVEDVTTAVSAQLDCVSRSPTPPPPEPQEGDDENGNDENGNDENGNKRKGDEENGNDE